MICGVWLLCLCVAAAYGDERASSQEKTEQFGLFFLEETEETDVEKQENKHKTKKKTENQFKDGRTVQPNCE